MAYQDQDAQMNNYSSSEDAALVMHARQGDQLAFAKLYEKYSNQISTYLTSMVGNDNVSNELTQEIFLKSWKALPTLRDASLFKFWLYRMARNVALDYRRQLARRSQISLDMYTADREEDVLSVPGPEEGLEQRELIELALSRVTPINRSCLILYVREGLSQREVAEKLNIKDTSVGNYISRGKEEFRQNYYRLLSGQGSVSPKRRKGKADE